MSNLATLNPKPQFLNPKLTIITTIISIIIITMIITVIITIIITIILTMIIIIIAIIPNSAPSHFWTVTNLAHTSYGANSGANPQSICREGRLMVKIPRDTVQGLGLMTTYEVRY